MTTNTTTKPMMKCGHAANAKMETTGKPVCVICIGIVDGADEVDTNGPDLTGRLAVCTYDQKERASSPDLPFFGYRPNHTKDSFYCGCRGWD